MKQLLLSAAIVAVSATVGSAACVPVPGIASGAIVSCTATDTNGFNQNLLGAGNLDDITFSVAPGARVDNSADTGEDTVRLDDDAKIVNDGTIFATGDSSKALDADNDATLENSGLIRSTAGEAIELSDGAKVTNAAGGVIKGFDDALQVGENAVIENAGRIENTQVAADIVGGVEAQDAIDIDSGKVTNSATGIIRSKVNAAIDFDTSDVATSTIDNAGLISGTIGVETDPANDKSQIVTNTGTIIGTAGPALNLGLGDDGLKLEAAGRILGGASFGDGDDFLTFTDFTGSARGIFDGGAGTDTLNFEDYLFSQLTARVTNNIYTLSLANGTHDFSVRVRDWNVVTFGTETVDFAAIADIATVPVPAGVLLLATALGGLALARRRAA